MRPTAEAQLQFLQQIQRLFEDGNFTATYKFALLMALAELAVEHGSDDTSELPLKMTQIAEKFAEFYWPQTAPYVSALPGTIPSLLAQNQGAQAAVVAALCSLRDKGVSTLIQAQRLDDWAATIAYIATIVRQMPVKFLQNVGGVSIPFLYDYPPPRGGLVLKQGVAFMLRTFHPLIQQLARAGWVRHVRENRLNASAIGQTDELETFMFGAQRKAITEAGKVLAQMQDHKCFYCGGRIQSEGDVDHFIPWSKYPRNLAQNFVLAHAECNRSKSDMLAAATHLEHWLRRNDSVGADLAGQLEKIGFVGDDGCSLKVAQWAYGLGVASGSYGWIRSGVTESLGEQCLRLF